MDLPAGFGPSVLRDLGGGDRPLVHRGVHVLRRRQRHPDAVHQRRGGDVRGAAAQQPRPAAARTTCARSATSWTPAATAACTHICAGRSLLLQRRLPLVLLVRAGVGRALHRRGRDVLRAGRSARRRPASGHAAEEVGPGRAAGGRALHDPARVRQPHRRQDHPPAVVEPAPGQAGDPAVRALPEAGDAGRARRRPQRHAVRERRVQQRERSSRSRPRRSPPAWSPTCRWRPPSARSGTPVVDVLAAPTTPRAGKPPPPIAGRGRASRTRCSSTPAGQIKRARRRRHHGRLGSHHRRRWRRATWSSPVNADGHGSRRIPIATGAQKLKLVQQTLPAGPCAARGSAPRATRSIWPMTVTPATGRPSAPVILSPSDPTHSPSPGEQPVQRRRPGDARAPCTSGPGRLGARVRPGHLRRNPDGTFVGARSRSSTGA